MSLKSIMLHKASSQSLPTLLAVGETARAVWLAIVQAMCLQLSDLVAL